MSTPPDRDLSSKVRLFWLIFDFWPKWAKKAPKVHFATGPKIADFDPGLKTKAKALALQVFRK